MSGCDTVYLDGVEHFQKMSYRNRYLIPAANGMIQLSIPLVKGRNQRAAMKGIKIYNAGKWQVQHWRTLTSVYKRSPYFDFYESELQELFETEYDLLADFNLATIHWLKEKLKLSFIEIFPEAYQKEYDETFIDLRSIKPKETVGRDFPQYVQMFSERNGFLPDMSILDLLFSEGPHAMKWITNHKSQIVNHK